MKSKNIVVMCALCVIILALLITVVAVSVSYNKRIDALEAKVEFLDALANVYDNLNDCPGAFSEDGKSDSFIVTGYADLPGDTVRVYYTHHSEELEKDVKESEFFVKVETGNPDPIFPRVPERVWTTFAELKAAD